MSVDEKSQGPPNRPGGHEASGLRQEPDLTVTPRPAPQTAAGSPGPDVIDLDGAARLAATASEPPRRRAFPVRVLHVCESFGSGVITAIADFVMSTPHFEHHLLASTRTGADTGGDVTGLFSSISQLPKSPVAAVRRIRELNAVLRPDVVHAHSSFAGAQVRVTPGLDMNRVVYTPHCYSFERRDTSRLVHSAFLLSEVALARRPHWVAAISPREAALAARIGRLDRTVYVPNIVRVQGGATRHAIPMTVVAVGRISPQKDPKWFAEAAAASRALGSSSRWRWLGGGDDELTAHLRQAGVHVTGWIDRAEVLDELSAATVYAHTAQWEGAPVALLEAAATGLPVVGRRIPALESLELPYLYDTPRALAKAIEALADPDTWATAAAGSSDLLARHDARLQAEALEDLYLSVAGRRPTVTAPRQPDGRGHSVPVDDSTAAPVGSQRV